MQVRAEPRTGAAMDALRRPLPSMRRRLIVLMTLALAVRLLVPAGWMPVADAAGARLAPCDGVAMTMVGRGGAAMPGMVAHHPGEGAPLHHSGPSDHPCAFAGPTAAAEAPTLALPVRTVARIRAPAAVRLLVAVGRGLAAPPPPSTGPPAFA